MIYSATAAISCSIGARDHGQIGEPHIYASFKQTRQEGDRARERIDLGNYKGDLQGS